MTELNKRSYFNDLAPRWDAIPRPPDMADRVRAFCRRACKANPGRVLDAGSGTGLLAPHLLGGGSPLELLLETDFAFEMLEESRRKLPGGPISRVCADVLRLPFPDEQFDAVLCFGILPHLGDPRRALMALFRVARPGGTLAIGHLMGSEQLNAMHRKIGGPVGGDTLPPAAELAAILASLGGAAIEAGDHPEGYFISARKEIR